MAEHFQNTAEALFKGMENFVTTKTVVGEAVYVGDTTILPLVEVSFGMAASARNAGVSGFKNLFWRKDCPQCASDH